MLNTYDPARSGRVYRHTEDPWSVPVTRGRTINRLPSGYANHAARTVLR